MSLNKKEIMKFYKNAEHLPFAGPELNIEENIEKEHLEKNIEKLKDELKQVKACLSHLSSHAENFIEGEDAALLKDTKWMISEYTNKKEQLENEIENLERKVDYYERLYEYRQEIFDKNMDKLFEEENE